PSIGAAWHATASRRNNPPGPPALHAAYIGERKRLPAHPLAALANIECRHAGVNRVSIYAFILQIWPVAVTNQTPVAGQVLSGSQKKGYTMAINLKSAKALGRAECISQAM